jgi:diadenosine tetraphosphate (Ap4A) HIT family hydrolase
VAIVDLWQVAEAHVLVLPRARLVTIDALDEATVPKLAWGTVRVSRAERRAHAPDAKALARVVQRLREALV